MTTLSPPPLPVPSEHPVRPGFATVRLELDVETATARICQTLRGVTATETPDGITFRRPDGTLIAILTGTHYEDPAVALHYRTAPASETATLKARRLARELEPFAVH